MITGPDIGALVVAKRPNQPPGQRQQRRRIQDGVVDDNFVTLQYAGQDLSPKRKAIGTVQMAAESFFGISNHLHRLFVDGGESRMNAQRETIHLGGNDPELVLQ